MSPPRFWPRIAPSLWVLVCALVTTVGLTFGLIGVDVTNRQFLRCYRAPNIAEMNLAVVADFAENSPDASEIVFVGDSTAICSLDPIQFERLTGLKSAGFATPGVVGIEGFTAVLRTYLDHHPPPRGVVLAIHPWAFGVPDSEFGPTNIRDRFLRCYGRVGVVSQLKAICKDLVTPDYSFATCKSLVRHAVSGMENLVGKCRGMTPEQHFDEIVPTWSRGPVLTYNRLQRVLREHRGFFPAVGALEPDDRWSRSMDFPVREENNQAMRKLIALTSQYSTPLIIRLSPVLTMPQEARSEELRDWLAQLERENPIVTVSRPEMIEYPPQDHFEEFHLNTTGAEKFTAFFAADVQRILAARRPDLSERADRNGF